MSRQSEAKEAEEEDAVVIYVLDPEPILFGAAALFAFSQAAYGSVPGSVEAVFRRVYVVGVGHAADSFALDGSGLDTAALRQMRRRDFPPRDHPTLMPGRGHNAAAARFVDGLVQQVIPFVEDRVLGLHPRGTGGKRQSGGATPRPRGVRRAILGASYSAVAALQVGRNQPL